MFNGQGAELLANALRQLTGLTQLQLQNTYLRQDIMAALSPALQKLTRLRVL
jgi:hypothetical protein